MAEVMYIQDDDGENSDEVTAENDTGTNSNQDDFLPPLSRLEKYASSDNMFNRQLVGRLALEALRAVADSPVDVAIVMNTINKMAEDPEVSVRVELMEQVPHIAMLCQEDRHRLQPIMMDYLLPLVVKFLSDSDNQVRKTTQAALLVLMEQGLVEMTAVEEQVCPVILMLTQLDSLVEFHTGAVALMSKMAPLIGRSATERLFMHRFAALCSDPVFYVRKVCAANFGEFCSVVGSQSTEDILLPRFVELCADDVWGVRKACAEVFMSVSCACTLTTRKNTLAPVFANLLVDQSRWVRMSAFQALGPFISTFADLSVTGLAYNQHGELVLLNPEKLEYRLNNGLESDGGDVSQPIAEDQDDICDQFESSADITQSTVTSNSQSSVINVCDTKEVVPSSDVDSKLLPNSYSLHNKERIDVSEDRTVVETAADTESANSEVGKNSGVLIAASEEECQNLRISQSSGHVHIHVESGKVNSTSDTSSFNTFQYWRVPIPEIELDISLTDDWKPTTIHVKAKVKDEAAFHTYASEVHVNMDVDIDKEMDNLVTRLEQQGSLELDCDMSTEPQQQQAQICTASMAVVTEMNKQGADNSTVVSSSIQKAVMRIRPKGGTTDIKMIRFKHCNPMDPFSDMLMQSEEAVQAIPISSNPPSQDIVPQLLIDHFVSMTHPSQLQNTDNEITHYCAFSIPAVALTLGRANWNLIKNAYEALASDRQWKVRRTVASSIHELAVILGEEIATKDLVPVFNGFIKDLDEVRIGALKHLADFLKLLRPLERISYLYRLSDFHFTDNECNWRFREELAEQLLLTVPLFSPPDTCKHITPIAIALLMDKVAAVRHMALFLVTQLVLHVSGEAHLVQTLLSKLAEQFAHNKHWNRRQTFALLCTRLISDQVLDEVHFAHYVLPQLLDLSCDPVPNVRLAVARTLASDVITQSAYFCDADSPQREELFETLRRLQKDVDRDVRYFSSTHLKQTGPEMEFS